MNIVDFLSTDKSMVIAPAGYGKTHTIVDSVLFNHNIKPILILTHTNAGVASIREKITKNRILSNRYEIITICGLAEQYVHCFVANQSAIPSQSDSQYYSFILSMATKVAKSIPLQFYVTAKYSHIIVDEFQDCSLKQLKFVELVGQHIPIHIMGDPLQSIYGFNHEQMVNMYGEECSLYRDNIQYLEIPWRWNNVGNNKLGCELQNIRSMLESNTPIELSKLQECRFFKYPEKDKYIKQTAYYNLIWHICSSKSEDKILVITPQDEMMGYREKIVKSYPVLNLLDAVDADGFYKYAKQLDECTHENALQAVYDIFFKYAKHNSIKEYFNANKKLIKSKKEEIKSRIDVLRKDIETYKEHDIKVYLLELIDAFSHLNRMKIYHPDIIWDLQKAIRKSIVDNSNIENAMIDIHNTRRISGRKIKTKSLATALLTKGLEFDHVVILDAHLFTDRRYFYVAITRGCKSVTIVSEKDVLFE